MGIIIIIIGLLFRYYCLVSHIEWSRYVYASVLGSFDIFLLGILVAFAEKYKKINNYKYDYFIITSFLLLFILVNSYFYAKNEYMILYQYLFPSIYGIITSLYIFSYSDRNIQCNKYFGKTINFFSSISFGFY